MKKLVSPLAAVLAAGTVALSGSAALGQGTGDQVTPKFHQALKTPRGYSMNVLTVHYAPGGSTPAHRHGSTVSLYAYVARGAIRSQVEGQPPHVYHEGEGWFEGPGAHHLVSENASKTEPADLVVFGISKAAEKSITTFDKPRSK